MYELVYFWLKLATTNFIWGHLLVLLVRPLNQHCLGTFLPAKIRSRILKSNLSHSRDKGEIWTVDCTSMLNTRMYDKDKGTLYHGTRGKFDFIIQL